MNRLQRHIRELKRLTTLLREKGKSNPRWNESIAQETQDIIDELPPKGLGKIPLNNRLRIEACCISLLVTLSFLLYPEATDRRYYQSLAIRRTPYEDIDISTANAPFQQVFWIISWIFHEITREV